jgi:hypothetical protein
LLQDAEGRPYDHGRSAARHVAAENFHGLARGLLEAGNRTPAAGRALADLVLDGTSEPDLSVLSVERFRGRYEDPADLDAYARKYMKKTIGGTPCPRRT